KKRKQEPSDLQFKQIAKEIKALRTEISKEFSFLHEHLDILKEAIGECASKIDDLKLYVSSRFEDLEVQNQALRRDLEESLAQSLKQSLTYEPSLDFNQGRGFS